MHPNAFLKTFWQAELRPQIFVAMSFADAYKLRFEKVIAPAIQAISMGGVPLRPYRVDLSKSGDSILTEIVDGIAHSQMVLADVSTLGHDSKTGIPYRNGNVMYEIGIALACRQSSEVLLVRDDKDKFLFDVSTIPHMTLNFVDSDAARDALRDELMSRLRERNLVHDARVETAIASLSGPEVAILKTLAKHDLGTIWGKPGGSFNLIDLAAYPRLLDKHLIKVAGEFEEGHAAFGWTPIGKEIASRIQTGLTKFKADRNDALEVKPSSDPPTTQSPASS